MNNIKKSNFNDKVTRIFSFLEEKYNYKLVQEDITFVRYESSQVFINFYHGRSSYEIGVEMGLMTDQGKMARLTTLVEAVVPNYFKSVTFQSADPLIVERCLEKIAKIIKKSFKLLLLGDEKEWDKVWIQQQLNVEQFVEKYNIDPVKENADKAWHRKEYKEVVKLYSSVEHYLTNTERKRLEYAKKQSK